MTTMPITRHATLATVAAALLAGCAATPRHEMDSAYVARVEAEARRTGTAVYWVNYPVRRAEPPAAEAPKK